MRLPSCKLVKMSLVQCPYQVDMARPCFAIIQLQASHVSRCESEILK